MPSQTGTVAHVSASENVAIIPRACFYTRAIVCYGMRRLAEKIYYGARYCSMRAAGYEWLFVLGHMRSGSSLLVHLLNSNPEVLGYGETPIRYAGRRSFVDLHDHVHDQFEAHDEPPGRRYRYVMEKILWPHVRPGDWLRKVPLSVIVIVRRPEATLPSMLSRDIDGVHTPKEALSYYVERLQHVQEMLQEYGSSFVLLTCTDLTERTDDTLRHISEYLGLDERLAPTYDTMWSTGESGIGDPSDNIKEGRVRLGTRTSHDVDLDPEVLGQARERYRAFCSFCEGNKR